MQSPSGHPEGLFCAAECGFPGLHENRFRPWSAHANFPKSIVFTAGLGYNLLTKKNRNRKDVQNGTA